MKDDLPSITTDNVNISGSSSGSTYRGSKTVSRATHQWRTSRSEKLLSPTQKSDGDDSASMAHLVTTSEESSYGDSTSNSSSSSSGSAMDVGAPRSTASSSRRASTDDDDDDDETTGRDDGSVVPGRGALDRAFPSERVVVGVVDDGGSASSRSRRDLDLFGVGTASSSSNGGDRMEAQRRQIAQNRRLQSTLSRVREQQRRDISSLKRALSESRDRGSPSSASETDGASPTGASSSTTRRATLSRSSSTGDMDPRNAYSIARAEERRGAPPLRRHRVGSQDSSADDRSDSSQSRPPTPKTPLRVRLKRRILRQQRHRDDDDDEEEEALEDDEDEVGPTMAADASSVSDLRSFASSFSRSHGGPASRRADTTRSEFVPGAAARRPPTQPRRPPRRAARQSSLPTDTDLNRTESGMRTRDLDSFSVSVATHDTARTDHATSRGMKDDDDEDEDDEEWEGQDDKARLRRQLRTGRRGEVAKDERTNRVSIHVYDLIASETIVRLPWGCDFPLGQCFNMVNSGLHLIGTGAYHVGVEVNGIEYAFGANNIAGLSGVFTCMPRKSVGYDYRCTLDFGQRRTVRRSWISVPDPKYVVPTTPKRRRRHGNDRSLLTPPHQDPFESDDSSDDEDEDEDRLVHDENTSLAVALELEPPPPPPRGRPRPHVPSVYREVNTFVEGHELMQQMAREYMGCDYELLRRNCCTFARDVCVRLGVRQEEIPTWFLSLAEAGVATEDAVASMDANLVTPLKRILSGAVDPRIDHHGDEDEEEDDDDKAGGGQCARQPPPAGFEVIAENVSDREDTTEVGIVKIVESNPTEEDNNKFMGYPSPEDDDEAFGNAVGIRHTLSWTY